jgi:GDP-L-fucose synthase
MPDLNPRPITIAPEAKIYVAGHRGLVGSALVRRFQSLGCRNIVTRTRSELDLCDQKATFEFFESEQPDYVILAAAKVGGILANSTLPAQFIHDNLFIATNAIEAARRSGVKKLLNLGSSCIYPKHAPQPIRESDFLTGTLEPTNRAYAIAKIAAIEMCDAYRVQYGCDFVSAMPTNLYGPGDNFDLQSSHVLPALLRKAHEAKMSGTPALEIWGTGEPRREFLHVDDMADACLFLLDRVSEPGPINVGAGQDISIRQVAELVCEVVGYEGELRLDTSKPDGTPRKLLDVSRLSKLGWQAQIPLGEGVRSTYAWFLQHVASANGHAARGGGQHEYASKRLH